MREREKQSSMKEATKYDHLLSGIGVNASNSKWTVAVVVAAAAVTAVVVSGSVSAGVCVVLKAWGCWCPSAPPGLMRTRRCQRHWRR